MTGPASRDPRTVIPTESAHGRTTEESAGERRKIRDSSVVHCRALLRNDGGPRRRALAAAVVVLGGLIAAVHGPAVRAGLFMDDHAHLRQLRECDWSLGGLTAACRLDLVGGTIDLWWLPPTTLRFFRPVAFGLMKLTYTLSGWNPAVMHVASLAWHFATCVLLMLFLGRLGVSRALATAVAGLFAIHPGHLATVQWIACQSELMVTTFLLAALLCFARYRGWPGFEGTTPAGIGWAVASAALFLLALGCRENAVMFPLVAATGEFLVRRRRRALALYAVFGVLLLVYLAGRTVLLGGAAVPQRPYVMPPGDPDFARFVCDKALYYLLGEYLFVPCVPVGGLPFFEARPLFFYGLAALVVVGVLIVCLRWGRGLPGLIGPAWLIGFMLPVLPVFASPHHLYLPGIGWAVTMMLALQALGSSQRLAASGLIARLRQPALWTCILLLGVFFSSATLFFGQAFQAGIGVENCLAEEIATAPSGIQDGDVLYVANLPVIGHYARLAVEERTGRHNLRLIPLTWSPRLLGPATPLALDWLDDRTLELRVAGDRYFGGVLGRLVREATGGDIPAEVDRTADLGFRVRVLARDAEGISALRFEFSRPPLPPGVHLFWTSRARWAYEVRP